MFLQPIAQQTGPKPRIEGIPVIWRFVEIVKLHDEIDGKYQRRPGWRRSHVTPVRIILAGFPPTTVPAATGRVTTDRAATTAWSAMVSPLRIWLWMPIHT